jgi:hypothetical protein
MAVTDLNLLKEPAGVFDLLHEIVPTRQDLPILGNVAILQILREMRLSPVLDAITAAAQSVARPKGVRLRCAQQLALMIGPGLRTARLRAERGLSQEPLAHERTYLSGVERPERNVSIDNIARIAKGLGVDPAGDLSNERALLRPASALPP